MKGFLHDHSSGFGSRAADTRHPSHAATADPGQSPEACRQAERTAEVGFSLLLLGKARRVAGSFFQGGTNDRRDKVREKAQSRINVPDQASAVALVAEGSSGKRR